MARKKRKRRLAGYPSLLLSSAPMRYRFVNCELDAQLSQLRRDGTQVSIEPRVFDVLVYLLTHRDRVVSKDELFDQLWPGQVVTETALTRCIVAARKAVGDDGTKQEIIETQHGRGYRFVATVTEHDGTVTASLPSDSSSISVTNIGQTSEVVLNPLPLPAGHETNEHADSASQNAKVKTQKSKGEDRKVGIARRKWPLMAVTGLLLLAATMGIVRDWPSSTSNSQLRTPNPQLLTPNSQPLPLPDKPSIVILPFTNLTGDPNQEILGDGIAEGMTTGLSKLPGLFIISRASAFTYKGKTVQAREVSQELGVRYVLEGSVQKATNDFIRVTAQLIDGTTNQLVWAEEYDRPVKNLFAVRDDLTRKLVTHIAPQITTVEQVLLERTYAGNREAYDYFVRGSFSWQQGGDKEKNIEGRTLCQKAVELDPSYAHAYACIGFTYWFDWLYAWTGDPQALENILIYGQKALTLDNSLSPAHELVGIYYVVTRKYERALFELERAVKLGPNWSSPHAMLGITLNATGRATEAISLLEHAVRLNSRHPVWHSSYLAALGNAYRLTGQSDKAIETLKKSLRIDMRSGAFLTLVATYSESGHSEQAQVLAGQLLQQAPEFSLEMLQRFSWLYKDPGDFERFLTALRKAGLK